MDIIKILFYSLLAAEAVIACVFAWKSWKQSRFSRGWIIAVILLLEAPHFIFPLTTWLAKGNRKKQTLSWGIPVFYLILLTLFSLLINQLADFDTWRTVMTGSVFARSATILLIPFIWKKILE